MDKATEIALDPDDWGVARAVAYRMVVDAVAQLQSIRERTVWQPMPEEVRARLKSSVPMQPTPLSDVYDQLQSTVLPYPMGNTHPRFFGWYMGGSNFTGALADFIAAIDGSNLGGGDTGATATDGQVVDWLKELMGFPADAGGTLPTR